MSYWFGNTFYYTVTLTDGEMETLQHMADRGYDCGMLEVLDTTDGGNASCDEMTYRIQEHRLWPVYEEYNEALERGDDPWGPFVAETLRPKLHALMAEVV